MCVHGTKTPMPWQHLVHYGVSNVHDDGIHASSRQDMGRPPFPHIDHIEEDGEDD